MSKFILPTKLSVIVPVRNEQDNVASLVAEIDSALSDITHEIIYVNDGSTDNTQQVLESMQDNYPQLRILRHDISCGQSTAVRTGVKYSRYDWIVTLDGDGQNDPSDIPKLIAALEYGVELVGGNRRRSRRDTWVKRMSSLIANAVRSKILRDHTPDTGCGLKLFSKQAYLDLPYFDHMHRFMAALIKRRGGEIRSVHVSHRDREFGSSNYGTLDRLIVGIIDLFGVAWLQRRAKLPIVVDEK